MLSVSYRWVTLNPKPETLNPKPLAQEKQKCSNKVEPLEAVEEAITVKKSDEPPKPAKEPHGTLKPRPKP